MREQAEKDRFRLTRPYGDRGPSLAEQASAAFDRLAYGLPLHEWRLNGPAPEKLLASPRDPLPGNDVFGQRLRTGRLACDDYSQPMANVDFEVPDAPESWYCWVHSWGWLRDIHSAGPLKPADANRVLTLARRWLDFYPAYQAAAWAPDVTGRRLLMAATYADVVMPDSDIAQKRTLLDAMARWCRHLVFAIPRLPASFDKIEAAAGLLGAAVVLPEATLKTAKAEALLADCLAEYIPAPGVIVTRSPLDQANLGDLMLHLVEFYKAVGKPVSRLVEGTLAEVRCALSRVSLGDGLPAPWHGGAPDVAQMERLGTEITDEPPHLASGFVKLQGGQVRLVIDAAPPPAASVNPAAHASTFAFVMTDGDQRLIVNCGGERGIWGARGYGPDLTMGLRSTAGHSALVLANTNSSRIHIQGPRALGGVEETQILHRATEDGAWFEGTHDGWRRRFGYKHSRHMWLSPDGEDLRGSDLLEPYAELLPSSRLREDLPVAIRFHLGPDVETVLGEDKRSALLQLSDATQEPTALWAFKVSFKQAPGVLALEPSLMIDGDGTTHEVQQLLLTSLLKPGGKLEISWSLRRQKME